MNFQQFKQKYLDYRTALGDRQSRVEAIAMAHAYELLTPDHFEKAEAVRFQDYWTGRLKALARALAV